MYKNQANCRSRVTPNSLRTSSLRWLRPQPDPSNPGIALHGHLDTISQGKKKKKKKGPRPRKVSTIGEGGRLFEAKAVGLKPKGEANDHG